MFGNVTNIYSPRVSVVSPSHVVTPVPAPGVPTQLCPPDLFCRFSQILEVAAFILTENRTDVLTQTFEKSRESLLKVSVNMGKYFLWIFCVFLARVCYVT